MLLLFVAVPDPVAIIPIFSPAATVILPAVSFSTVPVEA